MKHCNTLTFLLTISWLDWTSSMQCYLCVPSVCSSLFNTENCPRGIVKDVCGCCDICAKDLGETCGGPYEAFGKCGPGLRCERDLSHLPKQAQRDLSHLPKQAQKLSSKALLLNPTSSSSGHASHTTSLPHLVLEDDIPRDTLSVPPRPFPPFNPPSSSGDADTATTLFLDEDDNETLTTSPPDNEDITTFQEAAHDTTITTVEASPSTSSTSTTTTSTSTSTTSQTPTSSTTPPKRHSPRALPSSASPPIPPVPIYAEPGPPFKDSDPFITVTRPAQDSTDVLRLRRSTKKLPPLAPETQPHNLPGRCVAISGHPTNDRHGPRQKPSKSPFLAHVEEENFFQKRRLEKERKLKELQAKDEAEKLVAEAAKTATEEIEATNNKSDVEEVPEKTEAPAEVHVRTTLAPPPPPLPVLTKLSLQEARHKYSKSNEISKKKPQPVPSVFDLLFATAFRNNI